jgi:hypothetical protein
MYKFTVFPQPHDMIATISLDIPWFVDNNLSWLCQVVFVTHVSSQCLMFAHAASLVSLCSCLLSVLFVCSFCLTSGLVHAALLLSVLFVCSCCLTSGLVRATLLLSVSLVCSCCLTSGSVGILLLMEYVDCGLVRAGGTHTSYIGFNTEWWHQYMMDKFWADNFGHQTDGWTHSLDWPSQPLIVMVWYGVVTLWLPAMVEGF